jgi:glucose-6-phosphate 1-dehydrogenase
MQTLEALKGDLSELKELLYTVINLPEKYDVAALQSNELYKLLEQLSSYLSQKYHPQLLSGKYLHSSILKTAVQNYREQHRLHLSSLLNRL